MSGLFFFQNAIVYATNFLKTWGRRFCVLQATALLRSIDEKIAQINWGTQRIDIS